MARKRMIKPEFFTSRTIDAMTVQAALGFAGLWCYVDDYGRGEDDLALLKASIWPRRRTVTEAKISTDREQWVKHGVVCRYNVGGFPLLHVVNWFEHQTVNHPTESKLPPCPVHDPGLFAVFKNDSGGALEKFRRDVREAAESLLPNVVDFNSSKGSSSETHGAWGNVS